LKSVIYTKKKKKSLLAALKKLNHSLITTPRVGLRVHAFVAQRQLDVAIEQRLYFGGLVRNPFFQWFQKTKSL